MLRLIGKWLNAGVMDGWFSEAVQPRLKGRAFLVRYADDFVIGFTHYWARSRKGNWVVKRKTAASRFTRAVRTVAQWCRNHRHRPIPEQHQTLCQKLRGHYAYYGITGNSIALARFREEVRRLWWKWLGRRRSGNRPTVSWFVRLLGRYPIPNAVAVHSVCRRRSEGVS